MVVVIISYQTGTSKELVRITVGEWPPYLSKELKHNGVAAHIVTEAFEKEGMDVQYTFLPWSRALSYVEVGKYDGSVLWVWTEKRAEKFLFTEVMLEGEAVFFHLKSVAFDWKTYQDLAEFRIGGLLSATYPWVEEAKAKGIHLKISPVETEIQNFAKLFFKRIDVYGMDRLVGYHILQTGFSPEERQNIKHHSRPVEIWPYRIIFSRKVEQGPHFVKAFNKGMEKLKQERNLRQYLIDFEQGYYSK